MGLCGNVLDFWLFVSMKLMIVKKMIFVKLVVFWLDIFEVVEDVEENGKFVVNLSLSLL